MVSINVVLLFISILLIHLPAFDSALEPRLMLLFLDAVGPSAKVDEKE